MSNMSGVEKSAEAHLKGVAEEIKQLREDIARMGGIVEDLVRRRANEAVDEVTRRAERAWEDAGRLTEDAQHAMEKNPVATIGGAFGLGLLMGILFARR